MTTTEARPTAFQARIALYLNQPLTDEQRTWLYDLVTAVAAGQANSSAFGVVDAAGTLDRIFRVFERGLSTVGGAR